MPDEDYGAGRRDAWIEALRADVVEIKDTQTEIHKEIAIISQKVNHIYGGAMALGAFSGLLAVFVAWLLSIAFVRKTWRSNSAQPKT